MEEIRDEGSLQAVYSSREEAQGAQAARGGYW